MQPHTCNGKDYGLSLCVSYLSTNQHTVMTVEGTDHFRLDLTLLLYIQEVSDHFLLWSNVIW